MKLNIGKRNLVKAGLLGALALGGFFGGISAANAQSQAKNGVVLVHGAWHSKSTFDFVVPILESHGLVSVAVDLPGAGANAAIPASLRKRAENLTTISNELSPNASVTQDQRTEAVISAVRSINEKTGGKALILGHSLGGLTLTQVAEAIPEEISAIVYLTAFMLPPGMVAGQMMNDPSMAGSKVGNLLIADPTLVGALRIDVNSTDVGYVDSIVDTFYNDVPVEKFKVFQASLHPDEPAQVFGVPSNPTPQKYGTVPRYFVTCTQDNAIPYPAQLEMIRLMDESIGGSTKVFTLDTSHSPFLSSPDELAMIVVDIATN